MASSRSNLRALGLLSLIGLLLSGIATVLHPPVAAVSEWHKALTEVISHAAGWEPIHLAFAVGLILFVPGLSLFTHVVEPPSDPGWGALAGIVFRLSLPLWLITMAIELSAVPALARYMHDHAGLPAVLQPLAQGFWGVGLLTGYAATLLMWCAVTLWGVTLLQRRAFSPAFGWWAILSGLAGICGLVPAAFWPGLGGAITLAATSALPAAWLIVAAYRMWRA